MFQSDVRWEAAARRSLREEIRFEEPARVAALDVGSNSIHLLVVEAAGPAHVKVLERAKEMVRLGECTLRDGMIPPETFARGLHALEKLCRMAERHQPESMIAVATSAIREAGNGPDFVRAAWEKFGLDIHVAGGREEALLIYRGARDFLQLGDRRAAILDVGGGSTEAVVADGARCEMAVSMKLGVLRLRDWWKCGDPPSSLELAGLAKAVRAAVAPTVEEMKRIGFDFVAFTSGTALALSRLAQRERSLAVHLPTLGPPRLTLHVLRRLASILAALTHAERSTLPGLDAGRADTILPGAIVLLTVLEQLDADEAVVCDAALREGIVADYLERRAFGAATERDIDDRGDPEDRD